MGARHSKKSMDVTTTPKKDGVTVEGDASIVGDGKLERIEEADVKPTTNGTASHNETTEEKDVINDKETVTEKEKDKDTVVEKDETEKKVNSVGPKLKHLFSFKKSSSDNKDDKDKEKEKDKDKDTVTEKETETEAINEKKEEVEEVKEVKVEETKSEAPVETAAENTESVTTPTEETPASPTTATSPDSKESKKKDKPKKWFRSISFGKKDKSKPVRDEAAKNGDISREETLAEGSEEAENAAASPSEDKSIVASPTETEAAADAPATVDETKEAEKSSTIVEKNETPSSPTDPTPVPSEETKDGDNEKIENKIEVSLVETEILMPSKTKPIITTSVISRKTSEEFPSQLPSSPPPTPIDPSPLQQAQQTPANATALAEALKLPAETIKSTNVDNNIKKINDESVDDIFITSEEGPVPVTPENIETTTTTTPIVLSNEKQQDDIKNDNFIIEKNNDMPIEVEEKIINIINVDEDIKVEEKLNNQVVEEKIIEINTTTLLDMPIIDDKKMNIIEENNDKTVINNTVIINDDNIIEKNVEILESPKAPSTLSFEEIETSKSDATDEIPPPLPESPIPLPKANNDLLNFMSTQIADVPIVSNEIIITDNIIIKDNNKNHKIDIDEIKNDVIITNGKDNIELISPPSFEQQKQQKKEEDDDEEKEEKKDDQKEIIDDTDDLENLPPPPEEQISNNQTDSILTPPRSPSPTDFPPPIVGVDSSFTIQNGNQNHKLNDDDIISEDLHVEMKHNGDIINIDQCPLTILKNDQNTTEPEAVVEKTKEIITKEVVEEAPKVASPTVLVEAPVSSVPAGPVITEDVASVTQAIEEIDINEKAVAAAVNENIEAVKTNEIIADMNHQNTLKE